MEHSFRRCKEASAPLTLFQASEAQTVEPEKIEVSNEASPQQLELLLVQIIEPAQAVEASN